MTDRCGLFQHSSLPGRVPVISLSRSLPSLSDSCLDLLSATTIYDQGASMLRETLQFMGAKQWPGVGSGH